MTKSPDKAFGPEKVEHTYESIAEQVRRMKPTAQSSNKANDDMLTMMVWLRDETIILYDKNLELEAGLAEREQALNEEAAEVGVRRKAVLAVISTDPDNKGWKKWA